MTATTNNSASPISREEAAASLSASIWMEVSPQRNGCLFHSRASDYATLGGHRFKIGALIWSLFHGPMPEGWQVWRTCGRRGCAQPLHLGAGDAQACGQYGYAVSSPYHQRMEQVRLDRHRARSRY